MRIRPLHKGTIIGLYREKGSMLAMLAIEDDRQGKVLIPCYGTPAAKSFHEAFGGVLVGGRFKNDAIAGELIFYRVNELGILSEFCPVDEKAPTELIEEYEAEKKKPSPRKAGHIGFVEPDDPRIQKGPEPSKRGTHTRRGFLPPDHWLFGAGPIVAGREILKPHSPWTTEDYERNFQIARDAIAKGNQKPTEDN
jgi:hypothetical protein